MGPTVSIADDEAILRSGPALSLALFHSSSADRLTSFLRPMQMAGSGDTPSTLSAIVLKTCALEHRSSAATYAAVRISSLVIRHPPLQQERPLPSTGSPFEQMEVSRRAQPISNNRRGVH
jgi:hypothetical protein